MTSKTASLEELCDFVRDGTHGSPERADKGVPVLSAEHVRDGGLSFATDRFTTEAELRAFRKRLHPKQGDVLLTIVGTIGRVGVVRNDAPCVFQRSVCVLRPNKDRLDTTYLRYCLESDEIKKQMTQETRQVAQAGIYLESLNELRVPAPALPVQRRIAAQLEQADRLRRTRRYTLELSDSFLPATFRQLFGDAADLPSFTVEELLESKPNAMRTGPFGSQLLHSEFTDHGIAVLGIDNAVNNAFEWSQRRYISPKKYEQLERYTVLPGDVIITIMGTCGRCAIVPDDIPTAINTKHLCCITLDKTRCLPAYLHAAFLYHPEVQHQLGISQKGAIMDGLNMEIIKNLRIPLPPLAQQQHFATLVTQHERLRATQRESLRQAEHLFQTLLHRAFAPE